MDTAAPAAAIAAGHNAPPDDRAVFVSELQERHEALLHRRAELVEAAKRAPEKIEDDHTAGKVTDFIKQLTAHEKAANKARTAEKEPYLERGRWIDDFFKKTAVAMIGEAKKLMTDRLTAYQRRKAEAERKAREEEARRAREEAERAAREARAQAEAMKSEVDLAAAAKAEDQAAAAQARADLAQQSAKAAPAEMSRTDGGGASSSLRMTWQCTSFSHNDVDLEALRSYFTHAQIEAAIRKYISAGNRTLKGATIQQVARAVVR